MFAKTMIEAKNVHASAQACGMHYTTTFNGVERKYPPSFGWYRWQC